jgi:hypothetical protein
MNTMKVFRGSLLMGAAVILLLTGHSALSPVKAESLRADALQVAYLNTSPPVVGPASSRQATAAPVATSQAAEPSSFNAGKAAGQLLAMQAQKEPIKAAASDVSSQSAPLQKPQQVASLDPKAGLAATPSAEANPAASPAASQGLSFSAPPSESLLANAVEAYLESERKDADRFARDLIARLTANGDTSFITSYGTNDIQLALNEDKTGINKLHHLFSATSTTWEFTPPEGKIHLHATENDRFIIAYYNHRIFQIPSEDKSARLGVTTMAQGVPLDLAFTLRREPTGWRIVQLAVHSDKLIGASPILLEPRENCFSITPEGKFSMTCSTAQAG